MKTKPYGSYYEPHAHEEITSEQFGRLMKVFKCTVYTHRTSF